MCRAGLVMHLFAKAGDTIPEPRAVLIMTWPLKLWDTSSQTILLLKMIYAMPPVRTVIIIRGHRLSQTMLMLASFRYICLVIFTKWRMGLSMVRCCNHWGIFSTGEIAPDSKIAGITIPKVPINACCWVWHSDEINNPKPTSERP